MCVYMSVVCGFAWDVHSDGLHNTSFTEHLEGKYLPAGCNPRRWGSWEITLEFETTMGAGRGYGVNVIYATSGSKTLSFSSVCTLVKPHVPSSVSHSFVLFHLNTHTHTKLSSLMRRNSVFS